MEATPTMSDLDMMAKVAAEAEEVAATYPEDVQPFVRSLVLETGLIALQRPRDPAPPARKYASYTDLVLQLGSVRRAPLVLPEDIPIGQPQQCYLNSYNLVMENGGELTYCEGYALHTILRLPHAWVVDPEGRIIDPTWTGLDEATTHAYYAGVKFDPEFLWRHADETGWVSMFATDWERDAEMLKLGFVMDGDVAIGMGEL